MKYDSPNSRVEWEPPPPRRSRRFAGGAGVLLLLCAGGLWIRQPLYTVPPSDPVASPPYELSSRLGSEAVLCIVSEEARARGERAQVFEQLDPGRFWSNVVMLEHGAASVVDVGELPGTFASTLRAIVVTAAAMEAMEPHANRLESFVRNGGLVFLEAPTAKMLSLAGAVSGPGGGMAEVDRVRLLAGPAVGAAGVGAAGEVEQAMRLEVRSLVLVGGARPAVVGERAGAGVACPIVWTRALGRGGVVGIAVDLARLLVEHIQGNPRSDFTFRLPAREGALANVPTPVDLVAGNPEFHVPFLDLLVQWTWAAGLELAPFPGWWDVPDGADGAYLCTHDEEAFGDKTRFMAEEERRLGVGTTYFVIPEPMSREGVGALEALGAEVALHWHRGFGGGGFHDRSIGPWVLRREFWSLRMQREILSAKLSSLLPRVTRIHGLQWDADFDTTFRKLVSAGFRLDSSYGPHGSLGPYEFGSIRPFRPLDRSGRLLPILELPFVLQDDESAPGEVLREVMATGAYYQLPVVPIFHVNTMAYKPSVGPIEAWLEGFRLARDHGMWQGRVGQYLSFLEARERSPIRVEESTPGRVRGTIEVRGEGMWLRIPSQRRQGALVGVRVDDGAPSGQRCMVRGGKQQLVVAVPRGKHVFLATYGEGGAPVCGGSSRAPTERALPVGTGR